ncbi:hypothetical protein HELRODRAFT_133632, partial [Helobdella robusta]|uniref:Galactosyltransferase C-terminal domain-containing protein n=1 Tax=Helobdella robusta TaxID=6412 RepID=T1EI18_HELRO
SYHNHKLCLIVPFRDRFDELLEFIPYMKRFLCQQAVRNEIVVINQSDDLRFNRGSLINIGYLIAKHHFGCDYIGMHDVDLLPVNDQLNYSYPSSNPYHVSAPNLHPKYHYKNFVGGILLIKNEHFEKVNGLSNRFWGWGKEDDEFFKRLKVASLKIERPTNLDTGNKTFRHIHNKQKRPRDYERFGDQVFVSYDQKDNTTGLNSLSYTEISRNHLTVDGHLALVVNVHLSCNVYETPWC